jgi:hypothetical protein
MATTEDYDVDWNEVIKQAFFDSWANNSPVDVTNYDYKISNHFNLDLIAKKLQITIMDSKDKAREIKYHTNRLQILVNAFVLALLSVSDDGKMLTAHNIELAKHTLQEKEKCSYE